MPRRPPARSALLPLLALALAGSLDPPALSAQGVLARSVSRATYHGELAERMGEAGGEPVEVTRAMAVRDGRLRLEGFPEQERLPSGEWAMHTIFDLEAERAYVVVPSRREHHTVALEELIEEVLGEAPPPADTEPELRVRATGERAEVHGLPARRVLLTVNLGPDRYFGGDLHLFAELWLSRAPRLGPLLAYQERMGRRYGHLGLGSGLDAIRAVLGDRAGGALGDPAAAVREEELGGLAASATVHVVSVADGEELDTEALLRHDGAGRVPGQQLLIRSTSELTELRTGQLPDSLFRPPPGSFPVGPGLGRRLAERIREEGVEAATAWYRDVGENAPFAFVADRSQLSVAAREFRDRPEVVRALRQLQVEMYPRDPAAHRALAAAFRGAGMEDRAMASYRRVLELDPFAADARRALEEMGAAPDPPPEPAAVSPEVLEEYAGEYAGELRRFGVHPMAEDELAAETVRFRLVAEEGGLRLSWHQRKGEMVRGHRLVPLTPRRFVDEGAAEDGLAVHLDFGHGGEGEVELRLGVSGRRLVARRVAPPGDPGGGDRPDGGALRRSGTAP